MPVSPPAPRKHLHTRQIICQGFKREDGLWDIEGQMTDTKTYDFANEDRGGTIRAGEAVHHMRVRITIDSQMVIKAAEVSMDDTPFALCKAIAPSFAGLAGMSLGAGFRKALLGKFGGVAGCTHIVELMGPIATTAFQTMAGNRPPRSDTASKPPVIDRCHAMAADGPVVARLWPQYSTAKDNEAT
jgi:hypothetical protein